MKKSVSFLFLIIYAIAWILIAAFIGYIVGSNKGYQRGFKSATTVIEFKIQNQPIDSLKAQLKRREISEISTYINGKASIKKIDEGSLFSVKNVYYFEGTLSNKAVIAKAKDVKIKIDFISKTESLIGSQEVTIYDYINPGGLLSFRERVSPPEGYEEFKFIILGAIGE